MTEADITIFLSIILGALFVLAPVFWHILGKFKGEE
jgi:hypothetical protein